MRLDLFLLAVNDDLDLAADGHERVADNSGKIVVRVAPGVTLDHKLVMRRHAHVDADMVRVLGMLVCRILLDEHAATGDMIARMFELGDLLLNDRLDLLLVLNILHDKFQGKLHGASVRLVERAKINEFHCRHNPGFFNRKICGCRLEWLFL